VEDYEGGEIIVHRAEAVGQPGAHGGLAVDHGAGADELVGGLVVDGVGVHRFDDAEVIHHFCMPW